MLKPLDVIKKQKQVTEQETVILDQVILVYFQGPVVLKEEFFLKKMQFYLSYLI